MVLAMCNNTRLLHLIELFFKAFLPLDTKKKLQKILYYLQAIVYLKCASIGLATFYLQ